MKIIILAGGGGKRLYPLSTPKRSKQFLPLAEDKPLLVGTILRFLPSVGQDDIIIVTAKEMQSQTKKILKEFALDKVQIVCEPCRKNTAAATVLGVRYCVEKLKCSADEAIFVVPSDHIISPENVFVDGILTASKAVERGDFVVFGIGPTRADTGFGYIHCQKDNAALKKVLAFREKPNLKTAKEFLAAKNHFWNMGIFGFSQKTFLLQLQKHSAEFLTFFNQPLKHILANFQNITSTSLDYLIAEKSSDIKMLELDIQWSDVGSWDSYYDFLPKDKDGNATIGNVKALNCKNCLIASYDKPLKVTGLKDVLLITNCGVTVALQRGCSQNVRELAD